jgi:hypothetical protein
LNHRQPDKVVVDMGSTSITGIHASMLTQLRAALGLEAHPVKIAEPFQLLGKVEPDVIERLGIDVVGVDNGMTMFGFPERGEKPWKLQSGEEVLVPESFNTTVDENGVTYLYPGGDLQAAPSAKMPKGGYYFDNITRVFGEFSEQTANAREDFKNDFAVWTDEQLRAFEDRTNDLYRNTELGLICSSGLASMGDFAFIPGPGVKEPKGIRELTDFMVAHYTAPQYIHDLFGYQTEIALKNAKLIYEAAGDKIQAIMVSGTDFGMQSGPYMAPKSYREFYKPYHKEINDWIHDNTGWKTFYHTCGSIVDFLPDFHEAGIDILNPVQLSAKGMDMRMLKDEYGDKFVFWGAGVNTQQTLPFGNPEEVKQEVTERLSVLSKGGGFVFNSIHNIQARTPIENLLAMFEAVGAFNDDEEKTR